MNSNKNIQTNSNAPKIELDITTNDGQKVEIPVEGSLGLLALGYVGLIAWRMKRKQLANLKM